MSIPPYLLAEYVEHLDDADLVELDELVRAELLRRSTCSDPT